MTQPAEPSTGASADPATLARSVRDSSTGLEDVLLALIRTQRRLEQDTDELREEVTGLRTRVMELEAAASSVAPPESPAPPAPGSPPRSPLQKKTSKAPPVRSTGPRFDRLASIQKGGRTPRVGDSWSPRREGPVERPDQGAGVGGGRPHARRDLGPPFLAVLAGPGSALEEDTAQKRLNRAYGAMIWTGILASVVIHFLVFVAWPDMSVEDTTFVESELALENILPEVEIPPPPEAIQRPATPVFSADADVSQDVTIAPTTFEDNPVDDLPPPPAEEGSRISENPTFTPYTVSPDIRNRGDVAAAILEEYPPLLRDAGIGGRVVVWFFIDETGTLQDARVAESSGHPELDEAALAVADQIEFSPALNRDDPVAVWIQMPIDFQVR